MRLVVSEKNIAAKRIAEILAVGKPKADKVYNTPVYRFRRDGEDWVSIGLKGHILAVDFPQTLVHGGDGWRAAWGEGAETPAELPDALSTPPWPKKSKPYTTDGLDLKSWKLASLPYLVWAPVGKSPAEKEIIRALKKCAKEAETIVIATDYDREGELIGSDAQGLVREVNRTAPVLRARFSAITKEEIESAFSQLTEVDHALAQAGESRQDIDLVWGAVLTRFLTMSKYSGFGNVRSAGRVQTPTLALIVEREREREAFVPETYWVVRARFAARDAEFGATHSTARFGSEEAAKAAMAAVDGKTVATVATVEKRRRSVAPPAPFNTTELQAAAAAEGLAPARTMRVAESLYMNGLISYPRVDNTVYPPSLDLQQVLSTLATVPNYAEYVRTIAGAPLSPTRGKKETTDHPPIHPTGAGDPDRMKPEEWKLYNLVARRFLATLSRPAAIEGTKVTLEVGGETFVAKGDVLVEPGFRAIYPYGLKKDEQLPQLAEGSEAGFLGAELAEKQTEPPKRYGQGGLIQEMEKRGLGTKATRHSIIERLYDVRYVESDPIEPTCLGRAVVDALSAHAPRITTPEMTSELEAEMDAIASGRSTRREVVLHSRQLLAKVMEDLIANVEGVGEVLREAVTEDAKVGKCPHSGHDLLIKSSIKTRSNFVGCSGWPECDRTYPLPQGKIEPVPEPCAECGTPQVSVIQFRQKPQVRCLDPECASNHEPTVDIGACAACEAAGREGRLIAQRNPRTLKRFARCTGYEECKTSYPLPAQGAITATGERCEACSAPVVVVETRRGPWRICIDMSCPLRDEPKKGRRTGGRGGSRSRRAPSE